MQCNCGDCVDKLRASLNEKQLIIEGFIHDFQDELSLTQAKLERDLAIKERNEAYARYTKDHANLVEVMYLDQRKKVTAERELCARHIEALAIAIRDNGPKSAEGLLTATAGAQVGALFDAAASLRNYDGETNAPLVR
jgi:uncharacterized membrane protein YqiK